MTSRFSSIPGVPLPVGGIPSTLRRSTVIAGGPVSVVGGPVVSAIGGPVISNIGGPTVVAGGLRRSVVLAGGVGAPVVSTIGGPSGLRRSTIISPDQIPPGANIVRLEQPAQYIYKNPPVGETRRTTTVVTPPVKDVPLRPPVRHARGTAAIPSGSGCPWWLWLILGLLALLLLAGLLYGFFSGAFGGHRKEGGENLNVRKDLRNDTVVIVDK